MRPSRRALIHRLASRDGGRKCFWQISDECKGRKKLKLFEVTIDHVIAKSLMGNHNHGEDNLVIACSPCNSKRGAMPCLH